MNRIIFSLLAFASVGIWSLNAFNTFTLKHGWRFDVNLMYRSSGYTYNFYNDTYNLRLGLVAQKVCSKTARSPSVVPSSTACSITASTSRATWATTSSARPTDTPPTNSTSRSPTALTPLAANTREQAQARRHRRE